MSSGYERNVWVLIERAESVPGEWVAHCLDLDVVTQGRDLRHAFQMLLEAMAMVIGDDLLAGREPHARRAPDAEWKHLWDVVDRAAKRPPGEAFPPDDSKVKAFVAQALVMCQVEQVGHYLAPVASDRPTLPAPRVSAVPTLEDVVPLALALYNTPPQAAL